MGGERCKRAAGNALDGQKRNGLDRNSHELGEANQQSSSKKKLRGGKGEGGLRGIFAMELIYRRSRGGGGEKGEADVTKAKHQRVREAKGGWKTTLIAELSTERKWAETCGYISDC